jgi:glutamate N-acetyltransferase/amino-acid N-acetyltransferase
MMWIDGGVCAPRGFRAAAAAAGIKRPGSTRKDCALVVSDVPASIAGMFTTNRIQAAPVQWSRGICIRGIARAVFINSGNANACTGQQGIEDAQTTAAFVAQRLNVAVTEVAVLSTGVIGVPLPMDRLLAGADACVAGLRKDASAAAAEAIMTTDTRPKYTALEQSTGGARVRFGAMAKGAGMIAPNLATMLCVITTDARISAECLREALGYAVRESFNCICVDNDMSTNDAVLCLANGAAEGGEILPNTPEFEAFTEGLTAVAQAMAKELVRDGEGATKFVTIRVHGTRSDEEARQVAAAIAKSQLVKTAFFGEDANWGRIACAAGYSGVLFDPGELGIRLGGIPVMHEGMPTSYREEDVSRVMREAEIEVEVSLGNGPGKAHFWTSDLSYEYVKINAEYRS